MKKPNYLLFLLLLACSNSTAPSANTVTLTFAPSTQQVDGANNFLLVESITLSPVLTAQGCPGCPVTIPLSPLTLSQGQTAPLADLPTGTTSLTLDFSRPSRAIASVSPKSSFAIAANYDGVDFPYSDTTGALTLPIHPRSHLTISPEVLLYDALTHRFLDPSALLSPGSSGYARAKAVIKANLALALTGF